MRGFKLIALMLVLLSVVLSGCSLFISEQPGSDQVCIPKAELDELGLTVDDFMAKLAAEYGINETVESPENETVDEEEEIPVDETDVNETTDDEETDEEEIPVRTFTAGDLVKLTPESASDDLTYEFSSPLDANGEWQTTEEDAGEYIVNVTATNVAGASLTRQVKIVVEAANMPPVIEAGDVTVEAGETVELEPEVTDPDGDEVTVTYSGWMTSNTRETTDEDVGEHVVTITATDGIATVSENITVTVQERSVPPEIEPISTMTVTEGDLVQVDAVATHPRDDEIEFSYSVPLDASGEWQTEQGDAGTYSATVTATVGEMIAEETFTIVVEPANRPPVIEHDDEVVVYVTEGESKIVELEPEVTDPDGDEVTVTYSGWMDSATKEITSDDEGEHVVTIEATDGMAVVTKDVVVIVEVATPPQFDL